MAIERVSSVQDMSNIERMREQQRKQAEEKRANPDTNKEQSVPRQDAKVKQYEESIQKVEQDIKKTDRDAALSDEERRKKQMELRQRLDDLNRQLEEAKRQQEEQDAKKIEPAVTEQPAREENVQRQDDLPDSQEIAREDIVDRRPERTLSYEQQQALILGSNAVDQVSDMENAAKEMENRMRVLSKEIKLDTERGVSAEEKQKEQDKLSEKVSEVREKATTKLGETKRKVEEMQEEKETKREQVRFIQSQEQARTQMPVFQLQI